MSDGRIVIDTRIDDKGAVSGIKNLETSLSSPLKKIGKMVALAFSVKALVSFSKQAIELASDVQEVQNVVDTAFGSMSYKMEEFADTAIETYGISKLTAKQTGSTYMSMARGMGIAMDSASDMALALTGLSADMASFYNVSQDVSRTALNSIFTGETETLKKFGVVMTEANLSAFAMSQGISKSLKSMTQAEKVQLRYMFVMNQTSLAQGDFAKTSDSWANQTRILTERWKEFMSVAGNALIKVLSPAIKMVNSLLQYMIDGINYLADMFGFSFETATSGASGLVNEMDEYTDSVEDAVKAQKKLLGGYDKLEVISSSKDDAGGGSFGAIVGGGTATVDKKDAKETIGILDLLQSKFSTFSSDIGKLAGDFGRVFNSDVLPALKTFKNNALIIFDEYYENVKTVFSGIWENWAKPNLDNFINYGIPLLSKFVADASGLWSTLYSSTSEIFRMVWEDAVNPTLSLMSSFIEDMWIDLTAWYDEYGQPIFDKLNTAIITTKDLFVNIWNTVWKPIFDEIAKVVKKMWESDLRPYINNLIDTLGKFSVLALDFYNKFIAPIVSWLTNILAPIFKEKFNAIKNIVASHFTSIINIANGLVTTLNGIITFLSGVFTGDWKKAWEGIKTIFKGVWSTFAGIVKTPVNAIITFINKVIGAFEGMLNFVISGLNKLNFTVPDWVPMAGGKKFGVSLESVKFGRIPLLASGAVLPANNPFLAVVGDQKHGTNIETPLATMIEAFNKALDRRGGASQTIVLELSGRQIAEVVWDEEDKRYKQYY